ncbi:MAG: hypothetical protein KAJ24_02175, partial [Candidatus Aenigmarchaeota archaeon]|nr:hypothetical protein [Candidatus Aenigmarchaeota archaeon]
MERRRKGVAPLIGLVFLVAAAAILLTPGLSSSIVASISGEEKMCFETPYDADCLCPDTYTKMNYRFSYFCESPDTVITPDLPADPTQTDDEAIAFAKQSLFDLYDGSCDTVCPESATLLNTYALSSQDGVYNRNVLVECREQTSETTTTVYYSTMFDLEDGVVLKADCIGQQSYLGSGIWK